MKRVMTAALALSLLGGTSALAQQGDGRGHDRREHRQERRDDRQDRREDRQDFRQDRRETRQDSRQERRDDRQDARQDRREDRRDWRQDRRDDRRAVPPPQRGSPGNPAIAESQRRQHEDARRRDNDRNGRPDWNRDNDRRGDWNRSDRDHRDGWERGYRPGAGHNARNRDHGRRWYNPNEWRRSYHAPRRYRAPSYRYPSGWYVRTWSYGDILPWGWFTPTYYLDWRYYGLPIPPVGTEWVRVGDDALLVDVWTGRVLTAYYDLFW